MGDRTSRFGLSIFNDPDDRLDDDDWKFGLADRATLDRLLAYAVEAHTHDGREVVVDPPASPVVTRSTEDGRLPAGVTAYYKYALVDSRGQEQLASDMAVFHAPTQTVEPGPPILLVVPGAGTLWPGFYTYAVSAFTSETTQETPIGRLVSANLSGYSGITVTFPRIPSGADGWNVYRKAPGDERLRFITSVLGDDSWFDSGSVNPNPYRIAPTTNTTHSNNAVAIDHPAPEIIEEGMTWKVYRTTDPSNWNDSLLEWGLVTRVVDTGHATRSGQPPTTSAAVGSAPPIAIEDAAEVEGTLPPGMVVHPEEITFSILGQVHAGHGEWPFVCEWDRCEIVGVRAALGIGSAPAAQELIASIEKYFPDEDVWREVLDSEEWARIPVGEQIGELVAVTPSVGSDENSPATFMLGDAMRLMVRQEGAGATPTDSDLMVTVLVMVQGGSTTETHTWETS